MKHSYIWVGRKIRNSPAPIRGLYIHFEDRTCPGGCGYSCCSQTGPCAPTPAVVPHGPTEEPLPEGWSDDSTLWCVRAIHEAGCHVWRVRVEMHPGSHAVGWGWAPTLADGCRDYRATRDEAMAAALASVEPKWGEGWREITPHIWKSSKPYVPSVTQCETRNWQVGGIGFGWPSRERAMLEAEEQGRRKAEELRRLASVEPAEPKLHEGWYRIDKGYAVNSGLWLTAIGEGPVFTASALHGGMAYGLPTLEAAMRRAEELAYAAEQERCRQ